MSDKEKEKGIEEPLFGNLSFMGVAWMFASTWNTSDYEYKRKYVLASELERRFGHNGGILMDYACGRISFGGYVMWCDVSGIDDYNVDLLERVVEIWETFVSSNSVYVSGIDSRIKMEALKSRCFSLRYEISRLREKGNDNL